MNKYKIKNICRKVCGNCHRTVPRNKLQTAIRYSSLNESANKQYESGHLACVDNIYNKIAF